MTYTQLIRHYGTQAAAGKALGIGQSAVAQWRVKGVPLLRQLQYAHISPLRADRRALQAPRTH